MTDESFDENPESHVNKAAEDLANISKKTATEQLTLLHIIGLREAFEAADQEGKGALSCEDVLLNQRVVCEGLWWNFREGYVSVTITKAIYEN